MTGVDDTTLGAMPLFQGLKPEQLTRIKAMLRRRVVPAGTTLMMVDEPGEVAYLIVRGTVKIHADQADGTHVIIALRGPGEIVGEMSLVDRRSRSASAVTLEETTMLWWDRAAFVACLGDMPGLTMNLLRIVSSRLRLATVQIQALGGLDLRGRLARQILAFSDEYGVAQPGGATLIPLRLTQSDLAALVGASRVRVNTVIGEYRRHGLIAVDHRHRISVLDTVGLSGHCP